jgi:putative Ca2+/H+ antiporter (TMEM165/GDT1 family)
LASGFQPSGGCHFSPKPTVKIERPVWGRLCTRVAAGAVTRERHLSAALIGAFGATLVTFFLAERGDKTQIATVALAAALLSENVR